MLTVHAATQKEVRLRRFIYATITAIALLVAPSPFGAQFMRAVFTVVMLALGAVFTPARGGETATEQTAKGGVTAEEQIKTLEAQLIEAALKGDASSLEKYFADDYVAIRGDGKLGTKAQEIENLKSGTTKFESYDVRELKVRIYGDAAITNLLYFVKATINGKPYSGDVRATRVWVKQKDDWKLVTHQATRVIQ